MEVSIITLTLITFMINPINKDNLIKSPTMKEKSWLAGFIDGEGYIGITRQRKKESNRQSASLLYHPYLIISNSDFDVLVYIKKIIGYGYIHKKPKKEINSHQKPGFQYKLTKIDQLGETLVEKANIRCQPDVKAIRALFREHNKKEISYKG